MAHSANKISKIRLPDGVTYDIYDTEAVDLSSNQVIDGQKDFTTVPRAYIQETVEVPTGYKQYKFLESSGTQYINTNFIPTDGHKYRYIITLSDLAVKSNLNECTIFGSRINGGNRGPLLYYYKNARLTVNLAGYNSTMTPIKMEPMLINISDLNTFDFTIDTINHNASFSYNGNVLQNQVSYSGSINCGYPTFIFGNNASGTLLTNEIPGGLRLYRLSLYIDDVLAQDYVPASRDSDNAIGLYDIVNDTFFNNAGTGVFNVGARVYPHYETLLTDAAIPTNVSAFTNDIGYITAAYHDATKANQSAVDAINAKIPSAATSSNQLADKAFVNSSIETATATFKGTYNTIADIEALTADDNDYAFYRHTDAAGNTLFDRYKYNGTSWLYEYTLNNSSFTADQWAAINSGVSSGAWVDVTTAQVINGQKDFEVIPRVKVIHQTHNLPSAYQELEYVQSSGAQYIDTGVLSTDYLKAEIVGCWTSADTTSGHLLSARKDSTGYNSVLAWNTNSGLFTQFSGFFSKIVVSKWTTPKTLIGYVESDQVTTSLDNVTNTVVATSVYQNLTLYLNARHINSGTGAIDMASFKYYEVEISINDVPVKHYIPAKEIATSKIGFYDLVNEEFVESDSGTSFIEGPAVLPVTYESLLTDASFAAVAYSGNYNDLQNKPSIPTVNNATLTIQKNGTTVNTFTANASSNVTANITVPTNTNELTNGAGFITSSDIPITDVQVNGTSVVSNKIASVTIPTEIFWCTYGTTTYAEITQALSDGKLPAVFYNSRLYTYFNSQSVYYNFTCNYVEGVYYARVDTSNNWGASSTSLQNTSQKVTSLSSSSTDTQYPSAKCVYDSIEAAKTLIPDNTDYVDLTTNQVIDGQKDFETVPRVWVEPSSEIVVPSSYTQVDYIRFEGAQYTILNYYANPNTVIEADLSIDTRANKWLFGSSEENKYFALNIYNATDFEYKMGSGAWAKATNVSSYSPDVRGTIKIDNSSFYYNNIKACDFITTLNDTSSLALALGSRQTTPGAAYAYMTLYRFKIYENDILLHEYVPCYRNSDDMVGIYDIVDNEFFVSATDTDFIQGPVTEGHYEYLITDAVIPSYTSQLINDSGFITSSYHDSTKANQSSLNAVTAKIPSAATSSNQLADKAFVNSSIETATATFRGTYTTLEALQAATGDLNDYAFYNHTDAAGNTVFDRYKYTTNTPHWVYEYTLNNSSFTAAQWAAINSGVSTGAWVNTTGAQVIDGQKDFEVIPRVKVTGEHPREGLPDTYTQLQYVESDGSQYIDTTFIINTSTDTVDLVFELSGTTLYKWLFGEHDNNARFGLGVGDGTNRRNVAYGATTYKVNDNLFYSQLHYFKADISGIYVDDNKIADYSSFSSTSTLALFCLNNNGFVNGISGKIQTYKHTRNNTALMDLVPVKRKSDDKVGFYDFATSTFIVSDSSTDLIAGPEIVGDHYDSLLTSGSFANVAFSGSYLDLANTPTIPTVNNATLTIQKNGTNVGTFTANASSNSTVNITVPTTTSGLTNDSNFITMNDLTTITGYDATKTQTLKNINGVITWVTDS